MNAVVPVWDLAVRVLHWTLVASVALAGLSTLVLGGAHRPAGYVALAAVLLRVLWGGVGSRYARFAQFVRGPRATLAYLVQVWRHRDPRFVGHNPLGAWMVLALLGCVVALGVTGWLYTTDMFWGSEAVENWHRAFAWALLGLVVLHIAGVLFTGACHRENLVASMLSGVKRVPAADDIA